jgi:hypothetical protein
LQYYTYEVSSTGGRGDREGMAAVGMIASERRTLFPVFSMKAISSAVNEAAEMDLTRWGVGNPRLSGLNRGETQPISA